MSEGINRLRKVINEEVEEIDDGVYGPYKYNRQGGEVEIVAGSVEEMSELRKALDVTVGNVNPDEVDYFESRISGKRVKFFVQEVSPQFMMELHNFLLYEV